MTKRKTQKTKNKNVANETGKKNKNVSGETEKKNKNVSEETEKKNKNVNEEAEKENKEDEKNNEEMRLPYSYHTFMYPFSYHSVSEEVNPLNEDDGWLKEEWVDKLEALDVGNGKKEYDSEQIWMYNTYQYYFPKVRQNLFNMPNTDTPTTDTPTSIHYRYRFPDERESQNNGCSNPEEKGFTKKYIIQKRINIAKEWKAELEINNITLSLYPKLEIGVLTIETEYYTDPKFGEFKNAFKINDYGRRIFTPSVNYPYVEKEGVIKDRLTSNYMTADKITLLLGEKETDTIEIRFPELLDKEKEFSFSQDREIFFIKKIIGDSAYKKLGEMTSILDDRMFVACLIRDEQISKIPVSRILNGNINDLSIRSKADRLYNFVFLDGDSTTCQSDRMLVQKLNEHIYDRWINWGTFHGVTEYSMVCGTGASHKILNTVIMPFLVQYVRMVKLALVQRSEIVKLENEVCSIKLPGKGELSSEDVQAIRNIWKKYVIFQNELYLPEVTFQEQGVELYSMLKKSLKIDELIERLDGELANLKDLADMEAARQEREEAKREKEADEKLNNSLNLIGVLGFTMALFALAQDFISMLGFEYSMQSMIRTWIIYLVVFAGLGVISYLLFNVIRGENDEIKIGNKRLRIGKYQIKSRKFVWGAIFWMILVLLIGMLFWCILKNELAQDGDTSETEESRVCNVCTVEEDNPVYCRISEG